MKRFLIVVLITVLGCAGGEKDKAGETTIVGEDITYSADSTSLKGYIAYDSSIEGPRPGVIVVHEWWGHNDYARKRADMLAKLGYTALALDMYGDGKQAHHPDDAMKFMMASLENAAGARAKFDAALDLLKQHETTNPDQIAAIGYCFGGSVALSMARIGVDLDAVASFHGGLQGLAPVQKGNVKAKILVCTGAADPMIPHDQVDTFKQEMEAVGADINVISYEGAQHSFTNPIADSMGTKFNMPLAYNQAADQQSWEEMKQLFSKVFGMAEPMSSKN